MELKAVHTDTHRLYTCTIWIGKNTFRSKRRANECPTVRHISGFVFSKKSLRRSRKARAGLPRRSGSTNICAMFVPGRNSNWRTELAMDERKGGGLLSAEKFLKRLWQVHRNGIWKIASNSKSTVRSTLEWYRNHHELLLRSLMHAKTTCKVLMKVFSASPPPINPWKAGRLAWKSVRWEPRPPSLKAEWFPISSPSSRKRRAECGRSPNESQRNSPHEKSIPGFAGGSAQVVFLPYV